MRKLKIFILNKKKGLKIFATLGVCICLLWLTTYYLKASTPPLSNAGDYVILADNDLGMHCIQADYASYLILPPANTLKVQVFKKGEEEAELITKGIVVEYKVNDNTSSADKNNFWNYARDYGYEVQPNVGITGNKLSGVCQLSEDKRYFEATAIPVVPYNDNSQQENPYQTARITVKDQKTGKILAVQEKVVLPVSDEMLCSNCHGITNTDQNILKEHDEHEGTRLLTDLSENIRHRCNECHQDNALGATGLPGIPPLSQAMHGFHASRMGGSKLSVTCNNCHPGPVTQCNRGVMAANGLTCKNCHGNMEQVAVSQNLGRQAWLNEPDCGNCHGPKYGANPNTLYRNSYLANGPAEMNNKIQCASCHNSPHSEWPSTLAVDNSIPIKLMGKADFIEECTVCHEGAGKLHGRLEENEHDQR